MSSIRRDVDEATRDDSVDTAASSQSSVPDDAHQAADDAASGADRPDQSTRSHDTSFAPPASSVPGDPLAPRGPSDGSSAGRWSRASTNKIESEDRTLDDVADAAPDDHAGTDEAVDVDEPAGVADDLPPPEAEQRSLVASARAKLDAARRSIAERPQSGGDRSTEPVTATRESSYTPTTSQPSVPASAGPEAGGPPSSSDAAPIGPPLSRDDSPALAGLRRFDEPTLRSAAAEAPRESISWNRRTPVISAERHLIAPVQRAVGRRPRVRKVTRVVRHVDPWTVFKVAAVFSMVLYGVVLIAGVLLWNVAHTTGTIDNVEHFFETFGWTEFELKGGQIYHSAWIAGLFGALALTGLAVLAATLFNLITDLVGGIRFTVLEEEVVEKTVSPMRRFTVRRTEESDDAGVPDE